jgi:hypothetical protein
MHSSSFVEASIRAEQKLRVFILCIDHPSVAHANWLRDKLSGLAENGFDFSFESRRLDSVAGGSHGTQAAAQADVLVIAATALHQRQPALFQWLNSLALCDRNRLKPSLLIGLFGDDKNNASELDWMVRGVVAFTRRTQRGFLWQWMEREGICDSSWLAVSMEELCARRQSGQTIGLTPV